MIAAVAVVVARERATAKVPAAEHCFRGLWPGDPLDCSMTELLRFLRDTFLERVGEKSGSRRRPPASRQSGSRARCRAATDRSTASNRPTSSTASRGPAQASRANFSAWPRPRASRRPQTTPPPPWSPLRRPGAPARRRQAAVARSADRCRRVRAQPDDGWSARHVDSPNAAETSPNRVPSRRKYSRAEASANSTIHAATSAKIRCIVPATNIRSPRRRAGPPRPARATCFPRRGDNEALSAACSTGRRGRPRTCRRKNAGEHDQRAAGWLEVTGRKPTVSAGPIRHHPTRFRAHTDECDIRSPAATQHSTAARRTCPVRTTAPRSSLQERSSPLAKSPYCKRYPPYRNVR